MHCLIEDRRPALLLEDVDGANLHSLSVQRAKETAGLSLRNVRNLSVQTSHGLPNSEGATVTKDSL